MGQEHHKRSRIDAVMYLTPKLTLSQSHTFTSFVYHHQNRRKYPPKLSPLPLPSTISKLCSLIYSILLVVV